MNGVHHAPSLVGGFFQRWFPTLGARPAAPLRLFCFHHAGGTPSVYRDWNEHLEANVEIVLVLKPGRGVRKDEPAFTRIKPLVDNLVEAIAPNLDRPFAFFGHSMGALVSFELARTLAARGMPAPIHLFASGCRPPSMHGRDSTHQLPSARLIKVVRELGSAPPELETTDFIRPRLPLLRADLAVCETYEHDPAATIDCPITAYGGTDDPIVQPEELDGWADHTTASFKRHLMSGNHFFLQGPNRGQLLRTLDRELIHLIDHRIASPTRR